MRYEKELVFALRSRGLSEDQVSQALAEVQAHTSADDQAVQATFGPRGICPVFPN